MGSAQTVISGAGVFYGRSCWTSAHTLEGFLNASAPSALVHPKWGSCQAYLTELQITEEQKNEYLTYRFTFRKADGAPAPSQ